MTSIAFGIIGGSVIGLACRELPAKNIAVLLLGLTICLVAQHL